MKAHQVGAPGTSKDYAVRGLDSAFLTHTTYGLAARADGYGSDRQVWNAINAAAQTSPSSIRPSPRDGPTSTSAPSSRSA